MPELPDLEVIRRVLDPVLTGQSIADVEIVRPLVLRDLTLQGFAESLVGQTVTAVQRRGKLLLFPSQSELTLAINCKLAGRIQYVRPGETARRLNKTHVVFQLADGGELRYSDRRTMGQIYLTTDLTAIPGWTEMGPEPFDLTADEFEARLRPYRGEIKGILTRGNAVAGIGNAYADEICFAARIHPFRRRPDLTPEEIGQVYRAMQTVLRQAIETLQERVGIDIHREVRDFLAVHGKTGSPCPVCGGPIAEVKAQRRATNFCRTCQPGGLLFHP